MYLCEKSNYQEISDCCKQIFSTNVGEVEPPELIGKINNEFWKLIDKLEKNMDEKEWYSSDDLEQIIYESAGRQSESRRCELRLMTLQNILEFNRNDYCREFINALVDIIVPYSKHMHRRYGLSRRIAMNIKKCEVSESELELVKQFLKSTEVTCNFVRDRMIPNIFKMTRLCGYLDYLDGEGISLIQDIDSEVAGRISREFKGQKVESKIYGDRLRQLCFKYSCKIDTAMLKFPEHREKGEKSLEVLISNESREEIFNAIIDKCEEKKRSMEEQALEEIKSEEELDETQEEKVETKIDEKEAIIKLLQSNVIDTCYIKEVNKLGKEEKDISIQKLYKLFIEMNDYEAEIDTEDEKGAREILRRYKNSLTGSIKNREKIRDRIDGKEIRPEAHITVQVPIVYGNVGKPYMVCMKNGNFVDTPSLDEATIVNDYIEFYRDNTTNTEGLQFIKAYLSISRFLD